MGIRGRLPRRPEKILQNLNIILGGDVENVEGERGNEPPSSESTTPHFSPLPHPYGDGSMSEDMFKEIYGYEDVKQLFTLSLKSEKPIHILLCGCPASGKTLFLMSLMKLPNSRYYLGGQTSKAGLTEVLLKEKPSYLILDESLIGGAILNDAVPTVRDAFGRFKKLDKASV